VIVGRGHSILKAPTVVRENLIFGEEGMRMANIATGEVWWDQIKTSFT
jgi:hypothetical protein